MDTICEIKRNRSIYVCSLLHSFFSHSSMNSISFLMNSPILLQCTLCNTHTHFELNVFVYVLFGQHKYTTEHNTVPAATVTGFHSMYNVHCTVFNMQCAQCTPCKCNDTHAQLIQQMFAFYLKTHITPKNFRTCTHTLIISLFPVTN